MILAAIWQFSSMQKAESPISFTEFLAKVQTSAVTEIEMTGKASGRDGVPHRGRGDTAPKFRTTMPDGYEGFANEAASPGHRRQGESGLGAARGRWCCCQWAPIVLMIGFWVFIMRQMQSGGNKALSFGKSRAKLSS